MSNHSPSESVGKGPFEGLRPPAGSLGSSAASELYSFLQTWLADKGEAAAHLPDLLGQPSAGSGPVETSQLSVAASGSGPSVSTDKADYAPGETARISGSGFEPGSTVQITILETLDNDLDGPGPDNAELDDYGTVATVTVAADGTFEATWLVPPRPDASALGATLVLTASSSSGETATTTFTDADPVFSYTGSEVTHDESQGLQNDFTDPKLIDPPNPDVPGDADDNDIAVANLPTPFSSRLSALLNDISQNNTPIGAALSGYDGTTYQDGVSGQAVFTITGSYSDLAFTDDQGDPLVGVDSLLSAIEADLSLTKIYLYTDPNNNIVLGRKANGSGDADPNGQIVFAVYLDESTGDLGKIWTVQYQAIKHNDPNDPDDAVDLTNLLYVSAFSEQGFNLAGAPSGQNLFLMFTVDQPTLIDDNGTERVAGVSIIATGKDPADESTGVNIGTGDTINTSQAGGPTTFGTNNQMIVEGEGIRFTFVTGAKYDVTIPNLDQNEADLESNIDFTGMFNANEATFDVVQLQSGKSAVVKISAFNTAPEPGDDFVNGYQGDTPVNINSVTITFSTYDKKTKQTTLHTYSFEQVDGANQVADGLTVNFTENSVVIGGVQANYNIDYTTGDSLNTTTYSHNRVLVENAGSGSGQDSADFDIGGFRLINNLVTPLEVGSLVNFEDDGLGGAAASYTAPPTVYLFDGNLTGGNFEGNNGTAAPTGPNYDVARDGTPTSAIADFELNWGDASFAGRDGYSPVQYTYSLVMQLDLTTPKPVRFETQSDSTDGNGIAVTSGGLDVYWKAGPNGSYLGVVNLDQPDEAMVFSLAVDTTGKVTFTQYRVLDHTADTTPASPYTNDIWFLDGGQISIRRVAEASDGDGDPASETETYDMGGVFAIGDDGPKGTISLTGTTINTDETSGANSLQNGDTETAGEVTTYGTTLGRSSRTYAELVTDAILFGADGPKATDSKTFALVISSAGVDSGYDTPDGTQNILLYNNNGVIEGRVGGPSGAVAFTVEVDASTGEVTLSQYLAVRHSPNTTDDQLSGGMTANVLQLKVTATDKDLDAIDRYVDLGSVVRFEDDGPAVLASSNAVPTATSPNDYAGGGIYDFEIGSDLRSSSATDYDFLLPVLSGTVGGNPITNPSVSRVSEDGSSAVFNFSFSYQPNPNSTGAATETGTLTFNKATGTYSVTLSALNSYTEILTTANPNNKFVEYQGPPPEDKGYPEVVTIELRDDFFVQFTGFAEVNGNTPVSFSAGGDTAFISGEVIAASPTGVNVSSVAQGVAGNTIQSPEILDFDFFDFNPTNTTADPNQEASGIFLKFDGFGGTEDMVVILKLVDANDPNVTTTKAIVVSSTDIYTNKVGNTPPAEYGISLDNNDGAVIIERNDYNFAGENWLIEGAQILASTQGLTGSGINLNKETGSSGGSSGTQDFGPDTVDNDVFKILEIGFVTESTYTEPAFLNFTAQVQDADLDQTGVTNLGVAIVAGTIQTGTAAAETLTGGVGADLFSGLGGVDTYKINDLGDSLLASFDVITDYASGESVDAPGSVSPTTLIASSGNATALTATAISTVLTNATFGANTAQAFTVSGYNGTFIALNDGTAGFQADQDAVLFLQGYTIGGANAVTIV